MLLAGDAREVGDTLRKVAKAMVWGKARAPSVNLFGAVGILYPRDEVLDDALIQLMQDVWGDAGKDVRVREVLPEGMVDWFNPHSSACLRKRKRPLIQCCEGVEYQREATEWSGGVHRASEVVAPNGALRALAVLATHDEQLLRIVSDVGGQDRMTAANHTIAASEVHAADTRRRKRGKHTGHTGVKQICQRTTSRSLVGYVEKTTRREICEEYLTAARWLAADILWQVAEGHVHRVGTLVADEGELCLVGGDDDGDHGRARLLLLECALIKYYILQ